MSNNPPVLPSMPPPPPHWTIASTLSPPPVPTGKNIFVFGTPINRSFSDRLAQNELDILEKTNQEKIETRVSALKQLNKSMLVKYLQLIKSLVQSPAEYEEKVKELKVVMMNFQHLLNQYRPHEARETVITMLEKQLERRKEVLSLLKERIAAADAKVSEAKTRLSKQLSRIDQDSVPSSSEVFASASSGFIGNEAMDVTQGDLDSQGAAHSNAGLDLLVPYLDSL